MGLKETYNFEFLVNEAERMVLEAIERRIEEDVENRICKCQDCILDIAALALNSVKPLYRVSLIGTLYAHSLDDTEYAAQIQNAVDSAIEKIVANPAH
jgi:competence protein ComFB